MVEVIGNSFHLTQVIRQFRKKGQVGTIGPAIIALVIAGVFLILGMVMLQEVRDTDIVTIGSSTTVIDETLTTVTETGETVTNAAGTPGFSMSLLNATNATSGLLIASANYTVDNDAGTITAVGNAGYNNTNWNVSYTYNTADQAFTGSNLTIVGIATFADFWEIIVLAIVITIVIGLLLVVFGRRGTR